MVTDLAPADTEAVGRAVATLTNGRYRAAKKALAPLWVGGVATANPLESVRHAHQVAQRWWAMSADGGSPRLPPDHLGAEQQHRQICAELQGLGAMVATTDLETIRTTELAVRLDEMLGDATMARMLPRLTELYRSLAQYSLGPFLLDVSARRLSSDQAVQCLRYVVVVSMVDAISGSEPAVAAFDAEIHTTAVHRFHEADRQHIDSAPRRILRLVAEAVTRARDEYPAEERVLQAELAKKRKGMSMRSLYGRAPNILGTLKPCWAMSPLVVAQLLPPGQHFDVVVFDEASQVTPADAIGAISRAKRAVVAGDPMQLPPTSFFAGAVDDGDEEEEDAAALDEGVVAMVKGYESILDVMLGMLPPPRGTRELNWHYRSRDERLIAFSNCQPTLYNGSLITFPGVSIDGAVRSEYALQAFAPGEEQSSTSEVQRVVELVKQHAAETPDKSLGVIAFGIKHAERIEDALRRERPADEALDAFMSRGGKEPFFVKNLERVQGDERDSIILSVGFAKGADGRLRYFFGPINNQGGERRLNVAVTRARDHMTLVSSLTSDDLDPTKLRAEGAKMLRRYFEYCESGGTNLGEVAPDHPELNPFERDIQHHLEAVGIQLIPQYGVSGYWIDFAVKHPEHPGRMVLAIECDGASYHSSPTARDRDRLRQSHLENLGWRFHRIWSQAWFYHRDQEIERARQAYLQTLRDFDVASHKTEVSALYVSGDVAAPEEDDPTAAVPERGPRPRLYGTSITDYSTQQLVQLLAWIESDTLPRTKDELRVESMKELGFTRAGHRIVEALNQAIDVHRRCPAQPG